MTTEIIKAEPVKPEDYHLTAERGETISSAFMPKISERDAIVQIYDEIIKKEINADTCQEAGELRKQLVKVRTGIAGIHKSQKDMFLQAGRFVDAIKNAETLPVTQMEEKLKDIENYYDNIEKVRIKTLDDERKMLISEFDLHGAVMSVNLGEMPEEVWTNYYAGYKKAHQDKIEAEKKAEEERIAKEKAEAKERERIRLENEKLKKEAELREKQIAEENEKRETKEKIERAEREKREARIKAEAKAKMQVVEEELAKAKVIAQAKIKAENEEKAKLEAEVLAKAEAHRLAKLAPDKDKILKVVDDILAIELPMVNNIESKKIVADIDNLLQKTIAHIKKSIVKL